MCCQNSIEVDKKSSFYQKRTSVLPIYGGIEWAGYCLVVVAQLQCIGSSSYVDVLFLATAFFSLQFPLCHIIPSRLFTMYSKQQHISKRQK